jgi:predicted enzyme related to lactoylglutathione lyase
VEKTIKLIVYWVKLKPYAMEIKRNMVGWFEIPVVDMSRAVAFYQTVFDVEIQVVNLEGLEMGWFPWNDKLPGSPGSLVKHDEYYKPSSDGVLIYFSSQAGDLNVELNRVEAAGGTVIMPKTLIKEDIGYMSLIIDTEGNRVAIHSIK